MTSMGQKRGQNKLVWTARVAAGLVAMGRFLPRIENPRAGSSGDAGGIGQFDAPRSERRARAASHLGPVCLSLPSDILSSIRVPEESVDNATPEVTDLDLARCEIETGNACGSADRVSESSDLGPRSSRVSIGIRTNPPLGRHKKTIDYEFGGGWPTGCSYPWLEGIAAPDSGLARTGPPTASPPVSHAVAIAEGTAISWRLPCRNIRPSESHCCS
jgi:hypothetical protein